MSSPPSNSSADLTRSSSKRHNDGSRILNSQPSSGTAANLGGCRVVDITGDFAKVVSDPTQYVAIVIPRSLLPSVGALIEKATFSLDPELTRNTEPPHASTEEDHSKFLREFAELKDDMIANLRKCNEEELIRQVGQKEYDEFKTHRKELTKWYSTCQHLKSRLTNPSTTNQFLKMRYYISPAVEDTGVKDSCLNRIKSTKDCMESTLTHSVLNKASSLNVGISCSFLTCMSDPVRAKLFMKALRVVLKVNGEWNSRPDGNQRPFRRRGDTEDHGAPPRRPFRNTYRRRFTTRDDEDFPPPRRQRFNYRRFKRRPTLYTEQDDVFVEENNFAENYREERGRPFRRPRRQYRRF